MMRPEAFIYLTAALGFSAAAVAYVWLIHPVFHWGGLGLSVGLMIIVMMLLINTQAKTTVIYFKDKTLFIDEQGFHKNEIKEIRSYDYEHQNCAKVFFNILLRNSKTVYLHDTNLFYGRDDLREQTLKKIAKALQKHLDLKAVDYNGRSRYIRYISNKETKS